MTASYDAFGLLAQKTTSSASAYYLYDGTTPVVEMNYNGTIKAVCAYGPNGLLSRWSYQEGPSYYTGPVYYMYDPSGNVAQYLYASSGGYVNADYDAYGLNYTDRFGNPVPPPYGQPFGYQAQWGARTDGETGLVLMGWRYYDPDTGRFLTRDPIGYEGGINLYAYCRNNPVNLIDPLGLWGVQFGENGPNIGWGDPTWVFTSTDAGEGLKNGWGATADVMNPFGNPWAEMGYYDPCESWVPTTQNLTRTGLSLLYVAGSVYALAPQGLSSAPSQVVTHWGPEDMTILRSGDWVMTGESTLRNWIMSGSPFRYNYTNHIVREIPNSTLRYPYGIEWLKGLLGQRIYLP